MVIRKLAGSALIMSAVTALVIGVSAVPAFAAPWTVTPGGGFAGSAVTTTVLKDIATNTTISCTSSVLKGSLVSGNVGTGTHLGKVLAASFQTCTVGTATYTVTPSNTPWWLNAVSYASPVTTGNITGIRLALAHATCSAVVEGTTATNGTVHIKYSNSSHDLKVLSAGNLRLSGVSVGCGTLFGNGDTVHYTATYAITGSQTIASP
jgi:hypothetical protein